MRAPLDNNASASSSGLNFGRSTTSPSKNKSPSKKAKSLKEKKE